MTKKSAGLQLPKKKNSLPVEAMGLEGSPHEQHLPRLKRVRGQLEGIEKMILEKRYCIEILQQIKASRAALLSLEAAVLETHLKGCVRSAFASKDAFDAEQKIQEITNLLTR